jgi:hypothetical protein
VGQGLCEGSTSLLLGKGGINYLHMYRIEELSAWWGLALLGLVQLLNAAQDS